MAKIKLGNEWWTTPTESENGKKVIVTGRRGVEPAMETGQYNDRIEITWRYAADTYGMPDFPTSNLIGKVNDALQEAFQKEDCAVMTGIYTGDGERNWVFFVRGIQRFQRLLNEALSDFDRLPIEIYAEKDPNWNEYKEMKDFTEIGEGE